MFKQSGILDGMTSIPSREQAATAALAKTGIIPAGWGPGFSGKVFITHEALIEAMETYAEYRNRIVIAENFTYNQQDGRPV